MHLRGRVRTLEAELVVSPHSGSTTGPGHRASVAASTATAADAAAAAAAAATSDEPRRAENEPAVSSNSNSSSQTSSSRPPGRRDLQIQIVLPSEPALARKGSGSGGSASAVLDAKRELGAAASRAATRLAAGPAPLLPPAGAPHPTGNGHAAGKEEGDDQVAESVDSRPVDAEAVPLTARRMGINAAKSKSFTAAPTAVPVPTVWLLLSQQW